LIDSGAIDYKGDTIKVPKTVTKLVGGIKVDFEEAKQKGIGALTGIPLESKESKFGTDKKSIDPDMLWLKTRLAGSGILGLVNEPGMQKVQDYDEIELEEEELEIELNEKEPAFLANQTTKTCLSLQPVKITENPEGSMARAAMT
jgi:ATP-dependent RNA helicase DHX8/PRP22